MTSENRPTSRKSLNMEPSMKPSLSMTSLPPSSGLEGNESALVKIERPYNSLKKRRDSERDLWRRSWESGQSLSSLYNYSGSTGKDDFWAAIQNNYEYIMDTNLIDSCKEARGEIEMEVPATHDSYEVLAPISHEWTEPEGNVCEDTARLRRWLRDVEARLSNNTLSAAIHWPKDEIESKLTEHADLQREIYTQGRAVGALVRACGAAQTCPKGARGLERRYHLLYLKALEWQCHLESLLGTRNTPSPASTRTPSDTDEEPAPKLARLSADSGASSDLSGSSGPSSATPLSSEYSQYTQYGRPSNKSDCGSQSDSSEPLSSDDDEAPIIVKSFKEHCLRGGSEGDIESLDGDFHIDGDHTCVMSFESPIALVDVTPLRDVDTELNFIENTPPHTTLTRITDTVIKRVKNIEISKYNTPDRPANNFATFYFKHTDTDTEVDPSRLAMDVAESEPRCLSASSSSESDNERQSVNDSPAAMDASVSTLVNAEEADTVDFAAKMQRTFRNSKENIKKLVRDAEHMVREELSHDRGRIGKQGRSRSFEPLSLVHADGNQHNKMIRIKEWLRQSNAPVSESSLTIQPPDSCDASGECSNGESDSGGSRDSSGVPSGSVATFRRALDGSQCTSTEIIDADIGIDTPDNSPAKVVMRANRHTTARPWSVSCLSQLTTVMPLDSPVDPCSDSPKPMSNLAQFSISESALHNMEDMKLPSRNDSKEMRRKKLKVRKRPVGS